MCLACGAAVGSYQPVPSPLPEGEHIRCVGCGCDLEQRPPMSYAEMEALQEAEVSRADAWATALEARLVERWIGTIFVIALGAILLLALLRG